MRTIIAGGRDVTSHGHLVRALQNCGWRPTVVLSGAARGADTLGEEWAIMCGVPLEKYPADWDMFGKRAGYMRNSEMAEKAEALIALWDGKSRGTAHMIEIAKRHGLRVHVEMVA